MHRIRPKWVLKVRFAPEGSLRCQTDNFVGCPVVAVKLTVLHNSLQVATPPSAESSAVGGASIG